MSKKPKKVKKACYTDGPSTPKPKRNFPQTANLKMNTLKRIPSDFLVAEPSFASGVARLVDFGCAFDSYNKSATPQEADFRAALSDWISVGFDILDAVDEVEEGKKIA